jgi:hypothetical protein
VWFSERPCRPVQIGSSLFLSSSPIPHPAESGQYNLGELQSNELFVVSFRFTVDQSKRLEIRCFLGPMNVSSLVFVVANSTAIGTAPIFYNERKSILPKEHGKSVNCRRNRIFDD